MSSTIIIGNMLVESGNDFLSESFMEINNKCFQLYI